MATQVQIFYSETQGDRPAVAIRDRGELWANGAEKQLGIVNIAGDAIPLIGVPYHSEQGTYVIGNLVVQGQDIWRATANNGPGVFNPVNWSAIGGTTITVAAVAPVGPFIGQIWIDTSVAAPETPPLNYWDGAQWVSTGLLPYFRGNHDAAQNYRQHDCVVQAARVWLANAAIAPKAFDAADWTMLSEDNIYRGDHDPAEDYLAGDVVFSGGVLWRAPAPVGAGAFNPAQWGEVGQRPAYRGDHSALATYLTGDVVFQALELWRSNAGSAPGAFNPAEWTSLTQRSKFQGDYNPALTYLTADVVHQGGRLWRSNAGNAPEVFNPANWTVLQAVATTGDTFPVSPLENDLHYLTDGPVGLYIYYNDGNSTQWVQTNGTGAPPGTVQAYHNPSTASGEVSYRLDHATRTLECWGRITCPTGTTVNVPLPRSYARAPSVAISGIDSSTSGAPREIHVLPGVSSLSFFPRSSLAPNDIGSSGCWYAIGEWDGVS